MLVMPAPGLRVRDPHNVTRLVTIGEDIPETDLDWHRLIVCGDLVECTPDEAEAARQAQVQASAEAEAAPADQVSAPPAPEPHEPAAEEG